MTTPAPPSPLETGNEAEITPSVPHFSLFSFFLIRKLLYASSVLWAFAVACFFMLRFALLPLMEGARGWLDSLP